MRQRWLKCCNCERWRRVSREMFRTYKRSDDFECSLENKTLGCSQIATDFKAVENIEDVDFSNDEEALFMVKQSFIYLTDKIPKVQSYIDTSKAELRSNLENIGLPELMRRLHMIAKNLRVEFRNYLWVDRIYKCPPRYVSYQRILQFINDLDECIDWDQVDFVNHNLYFERWSVEEYTSKKRKRDPTRDEMLVALQDMVAAQAKVIKCLQNSKGNI
jgi:hypothetical protein